MASFEFLEDDQTDSNGQARFTVFGVGGAGGNAVQHMLESDIQGVKFVCANTDKQALDRMNAQFKIQLGEQSTRGLGAGANPNVGSILAWSVLGEIMFIEEIGLSSHCCCTAAIIGAKSVSGAGRSSGCGRSSP